MEDKTDLIELIIDENDESGVDYVALVDSPAIMSNWQAFQKHEFQETFDDYPDSASNNAKKAIKYKEENNSDCGTKVGWTRARQLASGKPVSKDIVKRMAQFNRHRKNARIEPQYKGKPWKDRGYVAWLGWGGTAGVDWAKKKSKE